MNEVHEERRRRPFEQMKRDDLADLSTFLAVANEGNFTRAAVRLGVSQSAVNHAIRRLEASLGLKLLNRTSRSVTTTDAGDKLLGALRPGFEQIDARIEELRSLGDAPKGLVRITASPTAARMVVWPAIARITRDYPEVEVELHLESRLTDIIEDRFDAGIRLGEYLGNDMVAVRVSPDLRLAAVASPDYLAEHGTPKHPRDLTGHACVNLRFQPNAPVYAWEFEKDGEAIVQKTSGPLILSDSVFAVRAAVEGLGIAYVMEADAAAEIESGRLRRILSEWCAPFPGFFLYYSGRRQVPAALRLVIDRLRYRA